MGSLSNLKFKKLPLSDWQHQWEIYQKELMQAKTINDRQERDYAIKDAEDKFNYWMDIYPKSNYFNLDFDKSWNYYRKCKNSKRNYKNSLGKKYSTKKSNSIKEELNWRLEYKTFIDHSTIELYNDKHFLGSIQYSVNNSCLHIEDIYTTVPSRECSFKHSYVYVGTDLFNILLLRLNHKGININKITGALSYADNRNKNWSNSIPFYADFNLHLHKALPYQLEFHLFSDSKRENEIEFPVNRSDRKIFIKNFMEEHLKSYTWVSFQYDIIPNIR